MNSFDNGEFLSSAPYLFDSGSKDIDIVFNNDYVSVGLVPSSFGPYTTVGSPEGAARRGAVILAYHTGDVLMLRQPRPALGLITWELPRGGADQNEPLGEAALRELKEEAGIEAVYEQLISLGKVFPDSGLINSEVEAFFIDASFGDKMPLTLGSQEQISEGMWVNKDVLLDACMDGRVECGYTLTAVLRAFTRQLL